MKEGVSIRFWFTNRGFLTNSNKQLLNKRSLKNTWILPTRVLSLLSKSSQPGMIKKVVISASNSKAIAFFDELNRKKEELRKKIEAKSTLKNFKVKSAGSKS